MRCFGLARLLVAAVGAFALRFLGFKLSRAVNLPGILRGGDFFCAAERTAARDVAFCLAIRCLLEPCTSGCGSAVGRQVSPSSAMRQRTSPRAAPSVSALVQAEHPIHRTQFGGLDQLGMGHGDSVERAFEFLLPEREKILERREAWKQVVVLPNVRLQQGWMIGQPVKD